MAQLVARLVRNEKVRGSNPLSSTTVKPSLTRNTLAHGATRINFVLTAPALCTPACPWRFRPANPARSAYVPSARCTTRIGMGTSTKSRIRIARSSNHRNPVSLSTSRIVASRSSRSSAFR